MTKRRLNVVGNRKSCTCEDCQGACQRKPGWFLPGEAEKAAKLKGLSLKTFFKRYLAVDFWAAPDRKTPKIDHTVFVLSPAVVGNKIGREFPANPMGTCVFFKDGRCDIHEAKPYECARALHGTDTSGDRPKVVRAWNKDEHQDQIVSLLGRMPREPPFSIFDYLIATLGDS